MLNEANSYSGSVTPSKKLQEMITAAYLRADVKAIDNRLWLVGGARFEKTNDEGWGPLDEISSTFQKDQNGNFRRDSAGNLIPVVGTALDRQKLRFQYRGAHAKKSYHGYYPSLNASFDLQHDLMLRAAYARTIGRPNWGDHPDRRSPPAAAGAAHDRGQYRAGAVDPTATIFPRVVSRPGGSARSGLRQAGENLAVSVPATPELWPTTSRGVPGEFAGYDIITKQNVGDARSRGWSELQQSCSSWPRGERTFRSSGTRRA